MRRPGNPWYDVVVHYMVPTVPTDVPARIVARVGREPDENSEIGAFGDLHWGFGSRDAAVRCAESLFEFAALDSVIRLVVSSYGDDAFGRKVYKDVPRKRQTNPEG